MNYNIFYIYLKQDDPKKSTMKKLERYGMAKKITINKMMGKIYLTPFSKNYLLNSDKVKYLNAGISVIDGSWNLINSIEKIGNKNARKLPLLLPVNPVNYGNPGKLSSLEAIAASLYIMGFHDIAENIISKYSWAEKFLITNKEPLNEYSLCLNNEDCIYAEKLFF